MTTSAMSPSITVITRCLDLFEVTWENVPLNYDEIKDPELRSVLSQILRRAQSMRLGESGQCLKLAEGGQVLCPRGGRVVLIHPRVRNILAALRAVENLNRGAEVPALVGMVGSGLDRDVRDVLEVVGLKGFRIVRSALAIAAAVTPMDHDDPVEMWEPTSPGISEGDLPLEENLAFDVADIRGVDDVLRIVGIAMVAGQGLAIFGPPGCGKTMLARRISTLLPALDDVTRDFRAASFSSIGALHTVPIRPAGPSLSRLPTLRAPHHTISEKGLVGDGVSVAGEMHLAAGGVLLLDEAFSFSKEALKHLDRRLHGGYQMPDGVTPPMLVISDGREQDDVYWGIVTAERRRQQNLLRRNLLCEHASIVAEMERVPYGSRLEPSKYTSASLREAIREARLLMGGPRADILKTVECAIAAWEGTRDVSVAHQEEARHLLRHFRYAPS